MSEQTINVYQPPEANLTPNTSNAKPVLEFKRFSAWGVFFLAIITFGIYPLYWINTRAKLANTLTKHTPIISQGLVTTYIVFASINIVIQWIISPILQSSVGSMDISTQESQFAAIGILAAITLGSGFINLINLILFFIIIYKLRSAFTEIINQGSDEPAVIGPVKTFFFNVLYLQYKLNEAIDKQSH